jgi:wyosine [tRNA(Phe)-imidazoG37] synthetase (radical SAM superfamily)
MAKALRPKMLLADPATGEVFEHPTFELALDTGLDHVRPGKKDLIDIPDSWDLMAMPGTRPVGYDPQTGSFETLKTFTVEAKEGARTFEPCAVAVHPPPGYVRTHHPAAEYTDTTHPDEKFKKRGGGRLTIFQEPEPAHAGGDDAARPGLPLWAYTAVGFGKRGPVAALFQADETSRWSPSLYYKGSLEDAVEERLAKDPDNPVLKQLKSCATDYLCCCAQNVFYERWEGAVPIAPACTAACLGCISKDPEWNTPVPQKRLKFSPKPEEIARVIAHHLETAPEPMMSFGQGCEGEPTMNHDVIVESIRLAREMTDKGVIHINTNASRPDTIRACAQAGCSSIRISLNTFDPEMYDAYYRPADYTFDDVLRTFDVAKEEGMYIAINLLIWPGWSDRAEELDRISEMVEAGKLHMIQLRNLCVDPGHYRTVLPPREGRGMLLGMRPLVDELHRRHPELRFGTFNPRLATEWYEKLPTLITREPEPAATRA